MEPVGDTWEQIRAISSLGVFGSYVIAAVLAWRFVPPLLTVLRGLTAALTLAATSLTASADAASDRRRLLALAEAIAEKVGAVVPPRSEPPS